jgi:hypothetical protein
MKYKVRAEVKNEAVFFCQNEAQGSVLVNSQPLARQTWNCASLFSEATCTSN